MIKKTRLISLDAFRGLTIILMLIVNNAGDWDHVFRPLEHADWHGCTVADLVFPFFVFIMGVAMPMGVAPTYQKIILRTVKLFGLGVSLSALANWAYMDHFRLMGVLQRLALTYFALANIILLNKRSFEIALFWLILISYSGAMIYYSELSFPKFYNLSDLIDSNILGALSYEWDNTLHLGHDPEGIFATIPTICSGLAGVYCGRLLMNMKSPEQAFSNLVKLGLGMVLLGFLASFIIPFNKNLWTPSYVIYTSGLAALVLGLFYYLIDLKKHLRPAYPLIAYGSNAIVIYFAVSVMALMTVGIKWTDDAKNILRLKTFLYSQSYASIFPPHLASALWGVNYVIIFLFLAHLMFQKKWFVKI
jgi:predicted acyltransferase